MAGFLAKIVVLGLTVSCFGQNNSQQQDSTSPSALSPGMLVGGAAWITFISLINALVQNLAPDWVRARVLAIFILVYQASFALGSARLGARLPNEQASESLLSVPDLEQSGV